MKKLLFLFLLLPFLGLSQDYLPDNTFGKLMNRTRVKYALGIPDDTTAIPAALKPYPHIAAKNGIIYLWTPSLNKYVEFTSGWGKAGNIGTDPTINFIGTTDESALVFKIRNLRSGLIDSVSHNTFFGYRAGDLFSSGMLNTAVGWQALMTNNSGSNVAVGTEALHFNTSSEQVGIGYGALAHATNIRNVGVGTAVFTNALNATTNTGVGNYVGLQGRNFHDNSFFGASAGRSNNEGSDNTYIGAIAGQYGTTSVKSVTISNGGSGFSSPVVTFSAPTATSDPGSEQIQATGTATLSGGVVTGITITNPGAGYVGPVTVGVSGGGGSGFVGTVNLISAEWNTSIGVAAGLYNRRGRWNTFVGVEAGYGDGAGGEIVTDDTMSTYVGFNASRLSTLSTSTKLFNATAIGYNAKTAQSNSLILGNGTADIGINTSTPLKKFDLRGTSGFIIDGLATYSPSSMVGVSTPWMFQSGSTNLGVMIATASSVSGATPRLSFYRTSSTDPSVTLAATPIQVMGSTNYLGVAGDNSTIGISATNQVLVEKVLTTKVASGFFWETTNRYGNFAKRMFLSADGNLTLSDSSISYSLLDIDNLLNRARLYVVGQSLFSDSARFQKLGGTGNRLVGANASGQLIAIDSAGSYQTVSSVIGYGAPRQILETNVTGDGYHWRDTTVFRPFYYANVQASDAPFYSRVGVDTLWGLIYRILSANNMLTITQAPQGDSIWNSTIRINVLNLGTGGSSGTDYLARDSTWKAIPPSGATTMAAIGSSPNANGATITGTTLTLQPASASFGGVMTSGSQSILGDKTFVTGVHSTGAAGYTYNINGALGVNDFTPTGRQDSIMKIAGFVADITALQAYNGLSRFLIVTDSLRGGLFVYTPLNLAWDNGVSFQATGIGVGTWIRRVTQSFAVFGTWYGVSTDSTSNSNNTKILAAIAYCNAHNIKQLWLTGKILLDAGTGAIFNLTQNGLEISGYGMGETKLIYPNSAVNAATQIFKMSGNKQWIHDLSIQNLAQSGTNDWQAILWADGAFYPKVSRVEIWGVYGNGTAGGAGIASFMGWNTIQYQTTLGSTFASGAQTATPASMDGIHIGTQLHVTGTVEDVVVTAITQTTFTATYVNAHNSTDLVQQYSQGNQYGVAEDFRIRDSWKASAVIINSSSNEFRGKFVIENIGSATTQHGMYIQGGRNSVHGGSIFGITGYGIHGHKAVPNIDATGDDYYDLEIGDCRQSAILVDGTPNGTSNTQIPNTVTLNRANHIRNIYIRNSLGFLPSSSLAEINIQAPSIIDGITCEDCYTVSGEAMQLNAAAAGSIIANLRMIHTNAIPAGGTMKSFRSSADNISFTGGYLDFGDMQITANGNVINGLKIIDGRILFDGDNNKFIGVTTKNATSDAWADISANTHSGNELENCKLVSSSTAKWGNFDFTNKTNTIFRNCSSPGVNNYFRYSNPNPSIQIINFYGGLSQGGNATIDQLSTAGTAVVLPFGASASIAVGNLLKMSGNVLVKTATTDSIFAGVATSTLPAGASNCFVVGTAPGDIIKANTTGAWVLGDYAIISNTVAGTFMDAGNQIPAAGFSYGRFEDAGAGTGVATIEILDLGNSNVPDRTKANTWPSVQTMTTPTFTTGFKIGGTAGTVGQYVQSDGTNMVIGNGPGQGAIIANTAAINTTETVIQATPALAANRLQAGTTIRITLVGTCTSTAANVSTFAIRIGTNGTTADGLMQSSATAVAATTGTAVPFRTVLEATVRTTGASATSHGSAVVQNNGVTGIATSDFQVIVPTFTNFNTTTASNIITVTYKSAATTTTCTFTDAFIEIINK